MSQNKQLNIRMVVYTALFTALIIIGGYISFPIPFSPLPVVLADLFVLLAGYFLGAYGGLSSVALFIFLGVLGLPVFAGGKAGLAVLVGPTAGFLLGYLLCAFVIGLISTKGTPSILRDIFALFTGYILMFMFGVLGVKIVLALTWSKALTAGLIPFLPGSVVKAIAAIAIVRVLRSKFRQTIQPQLPNNMEV